MFLGISANAQTQFSPTLTKIETSLFGVDYKTQTDETRLKRIEETVYGAKSAGTLAQRMEKLSKDIAAEQIGQEIKPKKDTFADDEDSIKPLAPKADSNVNYPIVNTLEQKIFSRDFRGTDINQRLSNLEQKTFKKTYSDDLNARVERLKFAIIPEKVAQEANYRDEDEIPSSPRYYESEDVLSENSPQSNNLWDNFKNNFSNGKNPTGAAASVPLYNRNNSTLDEHKDNADIVVHLAAVEKSVLRKTFPDDTITNRLSRLEQKVFNSTFIDDDEITRLERVASAYQAQKTSSKYDNNKFSQRMSTAMQVGAFLLVILAAIL